MTFLILWACSTQAIEKTIETDNEETDTDTEEENIPLPEEDTETPDPNTETETDTEQSTPQGSLGCGKPQAHNSGGVQIEVDWEAEVGGSRSYYLSLPANYDPEVPHRLVFGFSGTNWVGSQIKGYLDLERHAELHPVDPHRLNLRRRRAGDLDAGRRRGREQHRGLSPDHIEIIIDRRIRLAGDGHLFDLALGDPRGGGGKPSQHGDIAGLDHQFEGAGEQKIPHQNRSVIPPQRICRVLAAPQL